MKYDEARRAAALSELTDLTTTMRRLEEQLEQARQAAKVAVVRHLQDRSAPPAEVTARSPFYSGEVRAMGLAAGVPETHLPRAPRTSSLERSAAARKKVPRSKPTAAFRRLEIVVPPEV